MSEPVRFFLPGPVWVAPEVLEAMTRPVIGHRSAEFRRLYASLQPRLRRVLRTDRDVLIATSSATLMMESAVISTVRSDLLNLTCGAFSERWHAIARCLGKRADRLAVPWGEAVDPDLVRRALRRKRYEAVTLVHNETSTGVINPLEEVARAVREESDALLLVDTVSSLGGAPVEPDAWGLDLVLTASQKALALPPGLTLFSFSERTAERAGRLEHRGFYTDLLRYRDKHRQGGTITTPAVSLVYALDRQLDSILDEGMEARWARHAALRRRLGAWADQAGFRFRCRPEDRSPTVSCLEPPPGLEPAALLRGLAERGYTVASGYGEWKGSTLRIGHMGELRERDLEPLLAAFGEVMAELPEEARAECIES